MLDVASMLDPHGFLGRMHYVYRYSSYPVQIRENVAEHTFQTSIFSFIIAKDAQLHGVNVNIELLLGKCLLHDLDEAISGDCIRCFSGDTKVILLDGTEKTFSDLERDYKDKHFWVYSFDTETCNIVPGKASTPRKSGTSEVLEITFEGYNREISTAKCTANHLWLTTDCIYKRADELVIGESLASVYRSTNNGYETFWDYSKQNWKKRYRITAPLSNFAANFVSGELVPCERTSQHNTPHHMYGKTNDNPESICWMTNDDHWNYHASIFAEMNRDHWTLPQYEEWRIRMRKVLSKNGRKNLIKKWDTDPEYRRRVSEAASKNMIRLNANPEFREKVNSASKAGVKAWWDVSENKKRRSVQQSIIMIFTWDVRSTNEKRAHGLKLLKGRVESTKSKLIENGFNPDTEWDKGRIVLIRNGILYWNSPTYKSYQKLNHKVISIKRLGAVDVYDISVEHFNNFAISGGVFVHNSFKYATPGLKDEMNKAAELLFVPELQKLCYPRISSVSEKNKASELVGYITDLWRSCSSINDVEGLILKFSDFLTVIFFALREHSMGNRLTNVIIREVLGYLVKLIENTKDKHSIELYKLLCAYARQINNKVKEVGLEAFIPEELEQLTWNHESFNIDKNDSIGSADLLKDLVNA